MCTFRATFAAIRFVQRTMPGSTERGPVFFSHCMYKICGVREDRGPNRAIDWSGWSCVGRTWFYKRSGSRRPRQRRMPSPGTNSPIMALCYVTRPQLVPRPPFRPPFGLSHHYALSSCQISPARRARVCVCAPDKCWDARWLIKPFDLLTVLGTSLSHWFTSAGV